MEKKDNTRQTSGQTQQNQTGGRQKYSVLKNINHQGQDYSAGTPDNPNHVDLTDEEAKGWVDTGHIERA